MFSRLYVQLENSKKEPILKCVQLTHKRRRSPITSNLKLEIDIGRTNQNQEFCYSRASPAQRAGEQSPIPIKIGETDENHA